MIALLTATYDGYDALKELPVLEGDVAAICVTDDPQLKSDTWTVLHEPRDCHPNLAAKRPKMRPWDYTDAEWAVWIDASFRVLAPSFARDVIEYGPLAQFVHPDRDCCLDEAAYSAGLPKYADLPLGDQADCYRTVHPPHWGLWATGVIVRHRSIDIEAFGYAWLRECERWGYQDQVSEPYALREHGLRPNSLPGNHIINPWLRYEGSARH